MLRTKPVLAGLLASLTVVAASHEGRACGGVFVEDTTVPGQPPEQITVAAQRMALSISTAQTVLWSQVKYEGDPSGFAWVIPVGPGAILEEATDAWLEALDTFTGTQVVAPTVICHYGETSGSSGGCGCGSADLAGAGPPGGGPEGTVPEVNVLHEGSVGPYDTVTLDTSSGQALQQWLVMNGYAIPPEVVPTLDAYATEGLDFIALRLNAGANVNQMTPVRVVAPGASPIVPLRMMTAGADAKVPVTLFVITESAQAPSNFPALSLPRDQIVWDFDVQESNYLDLRAQALASQNGRGFLPAFAMMDAFQRTIQQPDGVDVAFGEDAFGFPILTLPQLYMTQAHVNAGSFADNCGINSILADNAALKVVSVCNDGSSAPGPCPDGSGVTAATFECDGFKDLAVALTGLTPSNAWVTRLEAELPRDALIEDLELKVGEQNEVSGWIEANDVTSVPCGNYEVEHSALAQAGPPPATRRNPGAAMLFTGLAASLTLRRPRRRRRQ